MKKKLLVLAAIAALGTAGSAWAAPQTTFEEGQTQIDLAASNVKASTNRGSTDDKWNFNGGLTYGLSDRWGVRRLHWDPLGRLPFQRSKVGCVAPTTDSGTTSPHLGVQTGL